MLQIHPTEYESNPRMKTYKYIQLTMNLIHIRNVTIQINAKKPETCGVHQIHV
jgi:hypothetical protein